MTLPADIAERLARLAPPSRAVIDGDLVEAASGATFHNVSPRNGQVLNLVTACQAEDVERAGAGARAAFEDGRWRDQGPREKKAVLFRLAELMERDADELALLESLDVGKPISDARNVDIPLAINTCRWYAEALDKVYGEVGTSPADRLSYAVHEPLGVIGAIVPWNFPLHMAMWKVAPALAMGNSVVLKPAEESPLTASRAGYPVIKALGRRGGDLLAAADAWSEEITLLVDAEAPGERGGTGRVADWEGASALARERRIVLAGGLSVENVGEAIRIVQPYAVDVASGIEDEPGRKNHRLMRAFAWAVESAWRRDAGDDRQD